MVAHCVANHTNTNLTKSTRPLGISSHPALQSEPPVCISTLAFHPPPCVGTMALSQKQLLRDVSVVARGATLLTWENNGRPSPSASFTPSVNDIRP